jgi:hypothetical protein
MKPIRMVTVFAAASLALAMPIAAIAPAQASVSVAAKSAAPDADYLSGCVSGSGGNVRTCAYIYNGGSGNYVTFMNVDGCVLGSGEWIHEEITGPTA